MERIWDGLKISRDKLAATSDVFRFMQNDIKGARKFDVSFQTRLRAWRYGFNAQSWVWLDLDHNDPNEYLNNIHARRVIPYLNGEYGGVLDDKLAFRYSSERFDQYLPELYGVIRDGSFVSMNGHPESIASIASREAVILKPISGESGQGVHKLDSDGDVLRLDGCEVTLSSIEELVESIDGYMVTACLQQHEYAATIFPESLNTIRVMTLIAPDTHTPEVVAAAHRFGTNESTPTDNWSAGGICSQVDVASGSVGRSIAKSDDDGLVRTDTHPDTGTQIVGAKIPMWEDVCEVARELAEHHFRAPYVGWDIAVTDDGPRVVEANSNPGINIIQIDQGVLANETAKRFFDRF